MSQKFCNILIIWQLQMLLPRSWRWQTTELWDTELTWYFPTSSRIYLHGLEHSLRIHGFRPTWSCLMIKVFATQAKFLELSGYCTVITFTFHTANVFLVASTVGWLVGFYGMSTHWVILCRIRFYLRTQFFFYEQFFTNSCFDLFNP